MIVDKEVREQEKGLKIFMKLEKLNKKALYCMYLVTSIVCVVIAAVLGVIVFFTRTEAFTSNKTVIGWVTIICAIIMILEIIETIVSPLFRYQRYAYGLTDEEVQIKEGYLFLTHTIVPISRLHKIEISSGPLDRLFGLAKVEITTAGGDVTIKFLEKDKAEHIADSLKQRINEIVEEERANGQ